MTKRRLSQPRNNQLVLWRRVLGFAIAVALTGLPTLVVGQANEEAAPPTDDPVSTDSIQQSGDIEFSFSGTSWREVIEFLARESNLALHIGEIPTGSLTYSDSASYSPDGAFELFGSGDHVSVPAGIGSSGDKTIAAWIKTSESYEEEFGTIFHAGGIQESVWMQVVRDGSQQGAGRNGEAAGVANSIRIGCGSDSRTRGAWLDGNVPVNDGEWHLVVGVCDATNGRIALYIDGNLISERSADLNDSTETAEFTSIGAYQNGMSDYFIGEIDEVQVYDRVLDLFEIEDIAFGNR